LKGNQLASYFKEGVFGQTINTFELGIASNLQDTFHKEALKNRVV
jgi:hypothetical protein